MHSFAASTTTSAPAAADPMLAAAQGARRYAPHDLVFQQGEPADSLFQVSAGALKLYKLTPDGRRQIVGFAVEGDILGLVGGEEYPSSAEALTDCRIVRLSAAKLYRLAAEQPLLGRRLLNQARAELAAAQEQMLLLGRLNPLERVASFLLRLSQQRGADRLELPMSRQDIADYLGLTIETVSRCFTKLRKAGIIELPRASEVVLRDGDRLDDLASGDGEAWAERRAA